MTPRLSLVAGACGPVGSHLAGVLARVGHRVIALDGPARVGQDGREAFPSVVRAVSQPQPWPSRGGWEDVLEGVGALFWCANHAALAHLEPALLAAQAQGLRKVVLISDALVYGEGAGERLERDSVAPSCSRAERLWSAEQAVREAGLSHVILRPTGVLGPRCARGLREARASVGASLGVSGEELAAWSHVYDVARAAVYLGHLPKAATLYNLAAPSTSTVDDLRQALIELNGGRFLQGRAVALARRLPESLRTARWEHAPRVDATRLRESGFRLEHDDLEEALAETVSWFVQEDWVRLEVGDA